MNTQKPLSIIQELPVLTMTVAFCSLLISSTTLRQTLQYDRLAVVGGQYWLLVTGHLSHWSADNLLWDLLVFIVLGIMAERRSRHAFVLCLSLSSLLIAAILWFFLTDMDYYRGISGLDSALFGFVAMSMIRERISSKDYKGMVVILATGAAFVVKIVYEIITLQTLFAASSGLYTPVPLAHLVGGLVGTGVALYSFHCLRDTKPESFRKHA